VIWVCIENALWEKPPIPPIVTYKYSDCTCRGNPISVPVRSQTLLMYGCVKSSTSYLQILALKAQGTITLTQNDSLRNGEVSPKLSFDVYIFKKKLYLIHYCTKENPSHLFCPKGTPCHLFFYSSPI
jgi:hypothetical protein